MKINTKLSKTLLTLLVLLCLSYTIAYASTTFTSYFSYDGDNYTMRHIYSPGTSSWNAYVQSVAPSVYSYVGGNTWAQRAICSGTIVSAQNNGGWANYNSTTANSSVESYSYASGTCISERLGIYALHQYQRADWANPINRDYGTSMARP